MGKGLINWWRTANKNTNKREWRGCDMQSPGTDQSNTTGRENKLLKVVWQHVMNTSTRHRRRQHSWWTATTLVTVPPSTAWWGHLLLPFCYWCWMSVCCCCWWWCWVVLWCWRRVPGGGGRGECRPPSLPAGWAEGETRTRGSSPRCHTPRKLWGSPGTAGRGD